MTPDPATLYDYWPALVNYCAKRLQGHPRAEAEDLAALVLERAVRAAPRWTGDARGVTPWLYTIAQHVVIDWHRRRRLVRCLPDLGSVDRERATTDAGSDRHLDVLAIQELLNTVTDEQRAVLTCVAEGVKVTTLWPHDTPGARKARALRRRKAAFAAAREVLA